MLTAYELAVSGKCPTMTIFWLKTRCGWTEFDERKVADHENKDNDRADYENKRQELLQKLMELSGQKNDDAEIITSVQDPILPSQTS